MSDLRDLLDRATTRPAAHPDPVGAVHARVRRRAARRRAAVAAGTTSAFVAAGVGYAARPAGHVPPAATATPTATPPPTAPPIDPAWRLRPTTPDDMRPAEYDDDVRAVLAHLDAHADVYVHYDVVTLETGWKAIVSVGGDVSATLWRERLRLVAPELPVLYTQCARSAADYDRLHDEVAATTWPSGNAASGPPILAADVDTRPGVPVTVGPCAVQVELSGNGGHERDVDYAHERWGADVRVLRAVAVVVGPMTSAPAP